ncbi:MAG: hypothetical protein ABID79_04750 [Elusimicrobiota bacterium]
MFIDIIRSRKFKIIGFSFLGLFVIVNVLWFVVASKKQSTLIGKTISIFKKEKSVTIKIKLPTGEIVELERAPKMSRSKKKSFKKDVQQYVILTGKIELSNENIVKGVTRVVFISDEGQLVMLVNPPVVNGLRMNYLGKYVKLRGYWTEDVPFLGSMRRCIWVEDVDEIEN